MAVNVNRVVLTGRLTRDPELRSTTGGTPVCSLRVANNTRRKDSTGDWVDKPNFFDVDVFGKQGENVSQYMSKGRAIAIDGRLEWREWEDRDGAKRQAVSIVADNVQFLDDGKREDREPPPRREPDERRAPAAQPVGTTPEYGGFADDDPIPF